MNFAMTNNSYESNRCGPCAEIRATAGLSIVVKV